MRIDICSVVGAVTMLASPLAAQSIDAAAALVGGHSVYEVRAGDTLATIGLSLPGLGIHGTNAPSSIYAFASHGCIRMHPDDIANLFQRVTVGMTGVLIYQPVVVAVIDGRVWLEAHPDEYRRFAEGDGLVRAAVEREALGPRINWTLVAEVLKQRRGLAVAVSAR